MKIRLVLTLTLSLLLLASIGSLVQAEDDSAGVDLTVVVIYPPEVMTIIASPVGSNWTVLRATLTDMGTASSVDVYFEWGVDTGYGSKTSEQTMTHPGAFWATITGLTPSTTYHFKSVAVGDSTSYSEDMSFTTISPPPPGPKKPPPGLAKRGTTDVSAEVSTAGVFTAPVAATSDDGLCILDIPEGTVGLTEDLEPLAEITMVTMEEPPPPPEAAHVIGLAYDFGPDGTTFEPAITLTFTYDPDSIPEGVSEEDLVIAYFVDGEWIELECVVDTETMTITASVSHFTTFAVIAVPPEEVPVEEEEIPPVGTPASFQLSNLRVTPDEVGIDEEVSISVLVENTGDLSGSYILELKINSEVTETKEVSLAGHGSVTVPFTVTAEAPGLFGVSINGLTARFTVTVPPPPPPPPPTREAVFITSNLSVTPSTVEPGENVTISIQVANRGDEEGSHLVELKIDGVVVETERVTLAGGASQAVKFTTSQDKAGIYLVDIDDLSQSFTVERLGVVVAPGPNWPLIGGIIGGVVVVVGLLVFFLVRRRKAHDEI